MYSIKNKIYSKYHLRILRDTSRDIVYTEEGTISNYCYYFIAWEHLVTGNSHLILIYVSGE